MRLPFRHLGKWYREESSLIFRGFKPAPRPLRLRYQERKAGESNSNAKTSIWLATRRSSAATSGLGKSGVVHPEPVEGADEVKPKKAATKTTAKAAPAKKATAAVKSEATEVKKEEAPVKAAAKTAAVKAEKKEAPAKEGEKLPEKAPAPPKEVAKPPQKTVRKKVSKKVSKKVASKKA